MTLLQMLVYILIVEDFLNRKFLVKKLTEDDVSLLHKKDNERNNIFLSDGKTDEQHLLKKKERSWIIYVSLNPVFIGILNCLFFASKGSLNITSFAIVLITTFCFSMASGYLESIRIKKFGITQIFGPTKRVVEFLLLQLGVFIWMNISIILLMEIFKQRYFR
jgi:hypothetical protein